VASGAGGEWWARAAAWRFLGRHRDLARECGAAGARQRDLGDENFGLWRGAAVSGTWARSSKKNVSDNSGRDKNLAKVLPPKLNYRVLIPVSRATDIR
jgi:hypothetical protein